MLSDFLRLIKGFILFIGPTEAGKTSILRRLVTGEFSDHSPTLGFREEQIAKVRVIEIGGQERFRSLWNDALENNPVHTFFVIDITKDEDWEEFRKYRKRQSQFTLIANKNDLLKASLERYPEFNTALISSAKTGEGMLSILESIASLRPNAEVPSVSTSSIVSTEHESISSENEKDLAESILKEYQDKF
jgi:GTPase SAR1 family protein